jgi:hypothetical protein
MTSLKFMAAKVDGTERSKTSVISDNIQEHRPKHAPAAIKLRFVLPTNELSCPAPPMKQLSPRTTSEKDEDVPYKGSIATNAVSEAGLRPPIVRSKHFVPAEPNVEIEYASMSKSRRYAH